MKRKRVCFIGDTPLQIMNCINLACNEFASDEYLKDIYIGHNFENAENVSYGIQKSGIFHNVYNFIPFNNIKDSVILRIISLLFPKLLFYKYNLDDSYKFEKYNIVLISIFSYFSRSAILAMRDSVFYMYEDGIGSYIGTTIDYDKWPLCVKILNATLFQKRLSIDFPIIYLNRAQLYYGNSIGIQMNKIDAHNKAMSYFNDVFKYEKNSLYQRRKIVYLTQPLYEMKENGLYDIERRILDFLEGNYNRNYIVRIHPRQRGTFFETYFSDNFRNLWELECINQITEDSILLNYYSTAAFEPAFLCDKKPYIFFLYRIFDINIDENINANMEKMIECLKEMYGKQKYKIRVSRNMKEFFNDITDVCNTYIGH